MRRKILVVTGVAALLLAALARAQWDGDGPLPAAAGWPAKEFNFARLAYAAYGCAGSRGTCNPWWAIDYPLAEAHFLAALQRMTRVQGTTDSVFVTLDDDRLYDYPWLFLQQVGRGEWHPHGEQLARLREYLERGGFLVVDDFHGEYEWAIFESAMRDLLPDRPIVDIPEADSLMHVMFDLDRRTQIPGERHLRYMRMEGPPHWRGIYDRDGRLMVAINHNIDMGDAWEHADDPSYPTPMTATAYKFGVNYVLYALTH